MEVVRTQSVSCSTFKCNYHVFLSFRGQDTRKTFTDHLYTALVEAGFRTFRDDNEIERGENVKSELKKAVQQSSLSIIVFSKEYASSKWCLDELKMILDCRRTSGQVVIPVFYGVDPSDVRKQTGSINEAFDRYENQFKEENDDYRKKEWMDKVNDWRAALSEIADLGGMVLQDQTDGYESKFIKKIVQVVEDKLKRPALNVPPYLIGTGYRVRNINKWLQDGSSEVGILTIYGTGGIGKTTIAKLAYNMNYKRFESSCFLPNVRETLEQSDGLLRLYKTLLSHMLKGDEMKIGSLDEGINMIRDVISCKKVLLVIDDVDQKNRLKLDPLLNMHHLFCQGSKIILTTRNKRLLKGHKVYKEHELQKFDDDESLELFSWYAFGLDHPLEEYLELSLRVVTYCGGLPLALHVLGSSLHGESVDVWKSTLEKLEEIPNAEILEILTVSYYSLPDDHDRNLFLDIACFFIGEEKSHVVTILNECDFHTTVGLENLINRSLLTIDKDNKVMMHQLIRDMGREIVRQESPNKPGKRRRLWHHKDSFNVLKQKTGTEAIEGLMLNIDVLKEDKVSLRSCNINNENDMDLETDAFTGMHSLRLLQINNVRLTGGYKQFPKNLRFLCWHGLPSKCVPRDFPLENLVAIDIRNSNIKQLSTGTKVLRHVKILNLSHCHGLTRTPEFSKFPSLERLILKDCVSLVEVHQSIVEVVGLVLLNLHDCQSLRKLPNNIGKLKVLETLIISGCSNLEELPIDLMEMECLEVFCADGVTLGTSHSTTEQETSWRELIWSWVSKPKKNPILLWDSLPHSLVSLSLANCKLSDDAFPGDFCNMPSLQNIDLSENPICFLPDCIKRFTRLNNLRLTSCTSLQTLIGLPKIDVLTLEQCTSLERVTFQTPWCHSALGHLLGCDKLVDMEGIFKVVPIGKIDEAMLHYLGLNAYDLESMKSVEMMLYNCYTYLATKGPIQGVYEYGGIFSIFLPGDSNVLGSFTYRTTGQSLSFMVPSSPPNARLRGFILRATYERNENEWNHDRDTTYIVTVLFNKTKDMVMEVYPAYYAIPGAGEDIIWLSHWNFGSQHFEAGDVMLVLVCSKNYITKLPVFEIKEVGINFVYEDQEQISNGQEVGVWYESWTTD